MPTKIKPSVVVVGSIYMDLTIRMPRLPGRGESVAGTTPAWWPGGKGANQAIAASRLGASVWMFGSVGRDVQGAACLAALREAGVEVSGVRSVAEPTSLAVVLVEEPTGENQIVVAQGANHSLDLEPGTLPRHDAMLCQLEVPDAPLLAAAQTCSGLFCLNAAPARAIPAALLSRIDVMIVNEHECARYGQPMAGLLAVTAGAREAVLYRDGVPVARCQPPSVTAVDTVGAGDTFAAALVVGLAQGWAHQKALDWACTAAALSTLAIGAQSAPSAAAVQRYMDQR